MAPLGAGRRALDSRNFVQLSARRSNRPRDRRRRARSGPRKLFEFRRRKLARPFGQAGGQSGGVASGLRRAPVNHRDREWEAAAAAAAAGENAGLVVNN